uniref:leucine-rich repeat protein n=1 Tax=uncultured Porphyromonas sp. TaxID=159274 RepID=UPI00259B88D9
MQYPNLSEYVKAIANAGDNLAELKHLVPVPDEHGEPYRSSGAFAVVFKMKDPKTGQFYALKCFTEEQEGRAEAYRKIGAELEGMRSGYFTSMRYYERELFVDSSVSSESDFPVLLMEWVEGQTMENYIAKYYQDSYKMGLLCHLFCKMASWLRSQPFAHGDIKPDNIIVGEKGELTLIDYDGMFVPSMAGQSSPTLGTQDFRHPLRKAEDFDATIDDFALASIALSLKAITLDPDLLDRFGAPDRLLFSANDYLDLTTSDALSSIWQLVADQELSKLLSLFLLAHAEQNLAATSFSLFSTTRPEEPVIEVLSTEVTKQDLEEAYTDEYGVKFSPDRKRLLKAPDGLESYVVPNTVTVICDKAFRAWGFNLTSITLPEGLKTIGESAFSGCDSLTSITLPMSLTDIGTNPFEGLQLKINNLSPHFCIEDDVLFTADKNRLVAYCSSENTYSVPCTVKTIGDYAFRECKSLTSITLPEGLKTIGSGAFCGCDNLTSITLPKSLTNIEGNPFCGSQQKINNLSPHFCIEDDVLFTADKNRLVAYCSSENTYSVPCTVKTIGDYAFRECKSLTSITLPEGLKTIGSGAFCGCDNLTSITLPKGLKTIGSGAFCGCDSLTSITLPEELKTIGNNAFYNCESLTSITLPQGLETIGNYAFDCCKSLTSITLPKGLKTIGNYAFSNCWSLTSIILPEGLETIGDNAFSQCKSLTSITLPEGLETIGSGAFFWCDSLTSITLPEGLKTIGNYAFRMCSSLTSITLPEGLETIGERAFWECYSLTSITLPEGLKTIGDYTFSECKSLTFITLPEGLKTIGDYTFSEC